jgi:hypothetical protein
LSEDEENNHKATLWTTHISVMTEETCRAASLLPLFSNLHRLFNGKTGPKTCSATSVTNEWRNTQKTARAIAKSTASLE